MKITFRIAVLVLGMLTIVLIVASCNRNPSSNESASQTEVKKYKLTGKVVSIDKQAKEANIDAEAIPGFMGAMTMPYQVKPESELDRLSAGDIIGADVVMQNGSYWLENVTIKQHATTKS